jgi:hypothetical protein
MPLGLGRRPGTQGQCNHPTPSKTILWRYSKPPAGTSAEAHPETSTRAAAVGPRPTRKKTATAPIQRHSNGPPGLFAELQRARADLFDLDLACDRLVSEAGDHSSQQLEAVAALGGGENAEMLDSVPSDRPVVGRRTAVTGRAAAASGRRLRAGDCQDARRSRPRPREGASPPGLASAAAPARDRVAGPRAGAFRA